MSKGNLNLGEGKSVPGVGIVIKFIVGEEILKNLYCDDVKSHLWRNNFHMKMGYYNNGVNTSKTFGERCRKSFPILGPRYLSAA